MIGLWRLVRDRVPGLGSNFLRFSSTAAVVDLVRDEDAFAYFHYFGSPSVMHFLTRVGGSPNGADANCRLDLNCDVDSLRKLDAAKAWKRRWTVLGRKVDACVSFVPADTAFHDVFWPKPRLPAEIPKRNGQGTGLPSI